MTGWECCPEKENHMSEQEQIQPAVNQDTDTTSASTNASAQVNSGEDGDTSLLGGESGKEKTEGAETQSDDESLLGEKKEGSDKQEAPKQKAPESYEFKVPEGMTLDQGLIDKVTPLFKELDLSQEQAQKLVDAYAPYAKEKFELHQKEAIDSFKQTLSTWKDDTKKELGDNFDKSIKAAAKAIEKFGSPELRTILNETGVGNHKELVKFFAKVGELISEDHFTETDSPASSGKNAEDVLYPTMKGKK